MDSLFRKYVRSGFVKYHSYTPIECNLSHMIEDKHFFHREGWHSWSLSTSHFPGEMAQFNQVSEFKENKPGILGTDHFFFPLESELPPGNCHSLLLHAGSYDFAFICIRAEKGKRGAIN